MRTYQSAIREATNDFAGYLMDSSELAEIDMTKDPHHYELQERSLFVSRARAFAESKMIAFIYDVSDDLVTTDLLAQSKQDFPYVYERFADTKRAEFRAMSD